MKNKKPLKILNINTDISTVGGSTICLKSLHDFFTKEGLDSRIFTAGKHEFGQALRMVKYSFFEKSPVMEYTKKETMLYILKGMIRLAEIIYYKVCRKNLYIFFPPYSSLRLSLCLRTFEPDIIILHNIHQGYINPVFLDMFDIPVFWVIHDSSFIWDGDFGIKENITNKGNFRFICPSKFMFDCVRKNIDVDMNKIFVINNGISLPPYNGPTKMSLNLDRQYDFVVVRKPNTDDLVDKTLSLIRRKLGRDIKVLETWYYNEYYFHHFQRAKVMLFFTEDDNYPYVVMESLASNTPVVSFDIGGVWEMIQSKDQSYVIDSFDVDAYADEAVWLLNRYVKKDMQSNALIESFNVEHMHFKYMNLIKEVCGKKA